MELWDVYDVDRNKTERMWVRGEAGKPGDLHLVVHVCVFNTEGEMLIQQRQSFKEGWPNWWDVTVGGSALAGETSQQAAQRELEEEIGLSRNFQNIRPHMTIHFENGFDDIYLLEEDVQLGELTLQYEEVQDVKWACKEDILAMIEEKAFIPYHKSLIDFLFETRDKRGTHVRENAL